MPPKQIQIIQIENGWLVNHVEAVGKSVIDMQGQQQPQMAQRTSFCADYEAVVEKLKEIMVLD